MWADRIERGLVAISTVTLLEAGFSARSAGDLGRALGSPPLASMPVEYLTPAAEDRAVDVQRLLAERGQHRAPSIPDLLIAAVAELTSARFSISTRTSTSSPTSPASRWSACASSERRRIRCAGARSPRALRLTTPEPSGGGPLHNPQSCATVRR